jgi:hypothetical protein
MLPKFRPVFAALFVTGFIHSVALKASEIITNSDKWQVVGSASLSVLWFDIYDATLMTANGQFESYAKPLAISLNYRRKISKKELIEETDKQLKSFIMDADIRQNWISQLSEIWPAIKKGDQLTYRTDLNGVGYFFFNKVLIGSIDDPLFTHTFPQIWLSPQGNYPKLASRLRGEVPSGGNQ